jgi:tetratricopeptide (TPR) repeat protein
MTALAMLDWQLGRYDDMARDAAEAIAAGPQPAIVFVALLKQQGPLATWWYEQWINDDPLADRAKTFEKALWLVVAQPPRGRLPENWRQLVSTSHAAALRLDPQPKAQRLATLGQTCQVRGDRELARQYFAEAAEADPANAIRAVDLAMADGNWTSAGELFEKWTKATGGDAIAIYLQGHCLAKAGDAQAGAEQMQAASLMALAPEARLLLAKGLHERGLNDAAIEQFELVRRTAVPDSPQATGAAQFVGILLNREKPLVAADAWEQLRLHVLNANSNFTEVEDYLSLSHLIHKARFKAASGAHEATKATAELEACDKLLPAEMRLLVEAIPALNQTGMTAVADTLFDRGFAVLQRVCEEFPSSTTYLNNAAWLCARSQRKLDDALTFVEKAIQLAPEEGAYYDTLAEVQFQRGDRVAAVAAAKKAVEVALESKFSAQRLKHFQDDKLKTLDRIEAD